MKFVFNSPRANLLLAGLLLTSLTIILLGTLSNSIVLSIENELQAYWRTTYDILVRPTDTQSSVEKKYDLLESNYLARISTSGGISYDQYQSISSIPDIEVAAPVAILTYIREDLGLGARFSVPEDDGVYLYEYRLDTQDGIQSQPDPDQSYYQAISSSQHNSAYYYIGPASIQTDEEGLLVNQPIIPSAQGISLLFAAIDPVQEAKLLGLDQAVIKGKYLSSDEGVYTDTFSSPFGVSTRVNDVPIMINANPYVSYTELKRISRVLLPADVSTLEAITSLGGVEYLNTLPRETLVEQRIDSDEAYPRLIDNLFTRSIVQQHYDLDNTQRPVPGDYKEAVTTFDYDGLVLDIMPPSFPQGSVGASEIVFTLKAYGAYDIERIPPPPDVNRVPLEIYYPPDVYLRYDENGQAVAARLIRPTYLGASSYVASPPLMLTTLDAARAITGDKCARCISAIRVRVALEACAGNYLTCPLSAQNQRKIETIAGEIARRTGLDVDIMVGSSPTRVLVHVPGIGYVEEQWIQKNVTVAYKEKVQAGHWLLMGTLLGIGGLFALDLAWADVVARRRTIALQKALGWRSVTVFRQILGQVVVTGAIAAVVGSMVAWVISRLMGWEQPAPALLINVPLLVAGLSAVGGLFPAWLAARLPPVEGLRAIPANYQRSSSDMFHKPVRVLRGGLAAYAWQGLGRRWSRTALGALTAALSAALLVLMLSVTVDRQGAMSGTLLGEFILVRIEGYHYAIVGMGFGLAALSLANSLLASVLERRREIGVFKAVGWRTGTIMRLFMLEGVLVGGLGGIAGSALGLAVFVSLYKIMTPRLAWIGPVGIIVPALVGMLAALYPAQVAANVPPAEAVRYE